MTFGKFASIVILLACTLLTSLNLVTGKCTEQDKNEILNLCKDNLKRNTPIITLPKDGPCCVEVRKINDMLCIIDHMTIPEKRIYDENKVQRLLWWCRKGPSPLHPNQNQVIA
ncbi:hypothetical protein SORBI_3005G075000 [Sorghum bicolor]|uniref:Bifunctional inhibitor/plant lipid transfer protein/seed storage helical domain-containing protein n=1 Tax=Sorghum bicolor TaxID=4558 RepID=A0A1B6PQQ9_SORBI|nr:hypothetical protein SORBI_3005G075000 [Sorghum bicolor]